MTSSIKIESFLTEQKLIEVLKLEFKDSFLGSGIKVCEGRRFLWDASIKNNNKIFFIEFDGDSHYRDPMVIKRDREKEEIAKNNGHNVIRIPYWVQLTNETFKYYFGVEAKIEQDYKHGFISDKAMLPSSYCEMGIKKFKDEFLLLPNGVRRDIVSSIKDKISKHGKIYTIPSSLEFLLND